MVGFLRKLFGGGKPAPEAEALPEPDLTLARAEEELKLKTEFAMATWGLGEGGTWEADLDAGTISFTNDKGWEITAPVQVIGTFNTLDGSWLWGWDHPSVPESASHDARRVLEFGEQYGLAALTTRKIQTDETDAWTFTALACHLAGAQGGYRGPAGSTHVFMTYGTVSIRKPDGTDSN
ncbi:MULTISPECIES: DUF6882 domain-containing protein [unclassified Sphingomonas]|uniref:DUF6882 domain-containing protein n=1 Tax=unclassified Sphingomonas TaxID=196159 RepID=UPI0022B51DE6|nr:DUF6882 domain-containing protein [Sphingomonas sp. NIBR02145]WHU02055.1 hypothetical protein O3305_17965 [Sphingomonas sp. NIBR02145]